MRPQTEEPQTEDALCSKSMWRLNFVCVRFQFLAPENESMWIMGKRTRSVEGEMVLPLCMILHVFWEAAWLC